MSSISYTRATAIDAVCRVAFLIVINSILLVSIGVGELKWVPTGWGWFAYKIGVILLSILPLLPLVRNGIIVDAIDIAFYEVLFFCAMALGATGTPETYRYFTHVLDPVVTTFLFFLNFLRLVWLPPFKILTSPLDWPPIGPLGWFMRHRVRRVVGRRQGVAIFFAIAALIPISIMVGKLTLGVVCISIGGTALLLVARYWPIFIHLLGNIFDDRARLARAMEDAARELASLKQALAEQAAQQSAMDEAAAELMLDEVVTPAGHEMLRQISQVHPGIRKDLIAYIMHVCQRARLERLKLVSSKP